MLTNHRRILSSVLFSALAVVLVACTAPESDGGSPDTKHRAQSGSAGAQDYQGDPPLTHDTTPKACNALGVDGLTAATVEGATDAPPAASGGKLEDGTYVFVKAVMYGLTEAVEPTSFSKSKLVIDGTSMQAVSQNIDGELDEAAFTTTETFTASGSSLTIATSCPANVSDVTASFSVVSDGGKTQLVIYHSSEGSVIGSIYEKQ